MLDEFDLAISPSAYDSARQTILDTIEQAKDELVEVSHTIHGNPEVAYDEHNAAALLSQRLEEKGFQVQRKAAELDTAFIATAGNASSPTIAILAEYDALPVIGHACGHNLMASAALGAGWAMRRVIDQLPGKVAVFGTPAEEGGGGKVVMVNRGGFNGVDAALIFHPATLNLVERGSLASTRVTVSFHGKASHAAAAPEKGINALDAIIQTFNLSNAMRQHLRDDARIMGIITNGGQAANIVPDFASGHFSIRANDRKYADEVLEKFRRCAEAAALATGATLEFSVNESSRYDNMVNNATMAAIFKEKLEELGLTVDNPDLAGGLGSTDMGNVSQVVPAIHPYLAIAQVGVNGHSIEFREAAGSNRGQETMLNAARAMALTTLELLARPALLQRVKEEFSEQASRGVVKG